ncbi:helix-turn-helix domain-containing protein [Microbacterium sp. CPCC 204701]|uniref:helix-turn-helix domain-containing protein n=1 Tax=Microbacterium sp. CPCC 204701 TaxID=2493084 RepID=UPI000FDB67B8
MQRALPERVDAYIRHHLHDPDLSPAKIAAANAISVRKLYRLYEHRSLGLKASIIEQRLLGARSALASTAARRGSIADIAASWGFSNPSCFTDRFRRRFGVTPREWREKSSFSFDAATRAPDLALEPQATSAASGAKVRSTRPGRCPADHRSRGTRRGRCRSPLSSCRRLGRHAVRRWR